jgi:methyl-accepting chemotaxis protein
MSAPASDTADPAKPSEDLDVSAAARLPAPWSAPLVATCCAASALLATQGGTLALAGPVVAALLAVWGVRCRAAAVPHATQAGPGAKRMVGQVIPVWQRHLQASRQQAEDGVAELLGSFSSLSDGLASAARNAEGAQAATGAGVTDELLQRHEASITALLEPMQRAEAQRERMYQQLVAFSDDLSDLIQQSKEVRQLASHTRLVAFNASIEANRAGRSDNGFQAVAKEVQNLAARSDVAGQRIASRVARVSEQLGALRREAALQSGSDEELRLSARQQARTVIGLLLADLADSMQSSRELRELSVKLNQDMEKIFMGFQFQDRFNQMVDVIDRDMSRLTHWVGEHDQASQADVERWLDELEHTYTMEEQRSHHHGTVEIQRNAGVEFF